MLPPPVHGHLQLLGKSDQISAVLCGVVTSCYFICVVHRGLTKVFDFWGHQIVRLDEWALQS